VALSVLVEKVAPEVVPAVPPLRVPLNAGALSPEEIVVDTVMLLPASPVNEAVIFTTAVPPLMAPTPTAAADPIALMILVASVVALTAEAPDHHWKFGLVLEPSDPAVRTVTAGGFVPLVEVVKPVLPAILAVTSTLGLVLLVRATPLLGWLAAVPHCQVLVVAPVLALPVVIAEASQETMLLVVPLVRMKHWLAVSLPEVQLLVLNTYWIPAIVTEALLDGVLPKATWSS